MFHLDDYAKETYYEADNVYVTGVGQVLLNVHTRADCRTVYCTIHNPSNHSMRDFPTQFRADKGTLERLCEHGVGHPDPDNIRFDYDGIHGCDGCCKGAYDV